MLQLENISYRYHANQPWAVEDISLTIPRGSFHLLSGPSGAGKTTLFKLLTLDLQPTQGTFTFAGSDITSADRNQLALLRRRIGIVFQDFRLLPHLTVQENIELPLSLTGKVTPTQQQAVREIMEWVGLDGLKDKPAEEISGGEQQRAAIARAVVHQPELLVADEPTGNVDHAMARRILHLFTELNRQGTTVVVATHDRSLFKNQQLPMLYLEHGRLVEMPGEEA